MNPFKLIFRDKKVSPPVAPIIVRTPEVGDEYRVDHDDPFPPKAVSTVLEVKGGWVRYRIGLGYPFDDERMDIKTFCSIYRLHRKAGSP